MIATFIRWRDACTESADEPNTPVEPSLITLTEIGWLIGEDDEVVSISMELEDADPGRWRLHVPKRNIIQRIDFEIPARPARARAVKAGHNGGRKIVARLKNHQLVGDGHNVNAVSDRVCTGSAGESVRDDAHGDPARAERNG